MNIALEGRFVNLGTLEDWSKFNRMIEFEIFRLFPEAEKSGPRAEVRAGAERETSFGAAGKLACPQG